MSVFRINKTKDFTVMSNYHLRDKNLSLKAKGLLSQMLSLPEDWDYSIKGLSTINKENETAIKNALNELKEYKYLIVTKLFADETENGRIDYIYDIYEQPYENQDVKKLGIENLYVENHSQYNINKQITNNKLFNTNISNNILDKSNILLEEQSSIIENNVSESKTKKLNLYQKCYLEIEKFTDNVKLQALLDIYLRMRLEIKDKPLYKNTWKGLLNKLNELSNDIKEQMEIVQQSLDRGYASFYELKHYNKNTSNDLYNKNVKSESYTKEELEELEKQERELNACGRKTRF